MGSPKEGYLHVVQGMKGNSKPDILDQRLHGKAIRQQVLEFGAVIGTALCIIAEYQYFRPGRAPITFSLLAIAPILYILCRFAPRAMLPVWKGWMKVGETMGLVVNFVLLLTVWIVMVIPFGFGLRLLGKKVMDLTYRAPVQTYWEDRTEASADFQLLDRQF